MKKFATLLILAFLPSGLLADGVLDIPAMQSSIADANGTQVAYKTLGDPEDPAVLLIMGLGASHKLWGNGLPVDLVEAGYHVIVFDNRDVGESQKFDEQGDPMMWWETIKYYIGLELNAPYDLGDMANDSVGLLDTLGLEKVHVVGASMGGMIAQVVAARHPDRVLSLTSIMSTPGFADHLPPPGELPIGESGESESEEAQAARLKELGIHLEAMPRQILAILKSGDRSEEVRTISAPTLVIHAQQDSLIKPEHGAYTAELIEGSEYILYEEMGHNLPEAIMPQLVSAMVKHMGAE